MGAKEDIIAIAMIVVILAGGIGIYVTQEDALITIPNSLGKDYDIYFNEGNLKIKQGYSNLGESVWQPYCYTDKAYRTVYKARGDKYSDMEYSESDGTHSISQHIYYSKGEMIRTLQVTNDGIKDNVLWIADDPTMKCYLRLKNTKLDLDNDGTVYSVNQEKTNVTRIQDDWLIFDYSTDIEKLSYVQQFNGKLYYTYKSSEGVIDIDPKIDFNLGLTLTKTDLTNKDPIDYILVESNQNLGYKVVEIYEQEKGCKFTSKDNKIMLSCNPKDFDDYKQGLDSAQVEILEVKGIPVYNYQELENVTDVPFVSLDGYEIEFDLVDGQYKTGFKSNEFLISSDLNYIIESNNISIDGNVEMNNFHLTNTSILQKAVSYWQFTDDATDSVGNNNGTVTGAVQLHERYEFDGNDFINAGNDSSLNVENFTLSAWVKTNIPVPGGDSFAIISKRNAQPYWHWRLGTAGPSVFLLHNGSTLSVTSSQSVVLDDQKWHHLAVVKNGLVVSFYVDGVFNVNRTTIPGTFTNINDVFIGKYNIAGTGFFNGSIDEVLVFNQTLTREEIAVIADPGLFKTIGNFTTAIKDTEQELEFIGMRSALLSNNNTNLSCQYRTATFVRPNESDSTLLGYYKLNNNASVGENSTNFLDYSGNGNNGTCTTCPNSTFGIIDGENASGFDGVDNYIDMGDTFDIGSSQDLTISAWIKTKSEGEIVAKSTGAAPLYRLQVSPANKILVRVNDNIGSNLNAISTSTVTDGKWHHIVAVMDRDQNLSVYVDGVLEAGTNISAVGDLDNAGIFAIGRFGSSSSNYFNGTIDEVVLYNRSLTQEEIINYSSYNPLTLMNFSYSNSNTSRYIQGRCVLETNSTRETPIVDSLFYEYIVDSASNIKEYIWQGLNTLTAGTSSYFGVYFDTNESSKRYPNYDVDLTVNESREWITNETRPITQLQAYEDRGGGF